MRGKARVVLLMVVAGLLLVGCGTAPSTGSSYSGRAGSTAAAPPTTDGVAPEGGYLQFGTPYSIPAGTWDVRTSKPRPYKRTAAAAGGEEGERFVRVDITLTNRTQRYIDVGQEWRITLGVDGSPASEVFDSGAGVQGSSPTALAAPGKPVTFGVVWALAQAPGTVQIGLDPNSDPSGQSHVLYQGRV